MDAVTACACARSTREALSDRKAMALVYLDVKRSRSPKYNWMHAAIPRERWSTAWLNTAGLPLVLKCQPARVDGAPRGVMELRQSKEAARFAADGKLIPRPRSRILSEVVVVLIVVVIAATSAAVATSDAGAAVLARADVFNPRAETSVLLFKSMRPTGKSEGRPSFFDLDMKFQDDSAADSSIECGVLGEYMRRSLLCSPTMF